MPTASVVPVGTPGSSIVCRSVLDNSDPTCVPYDPFGAAPSAAAVNYLNVFGVIQGITSEQIANFNVTGLLGEMGWKTPWAEDGVAINAGVEYRRESLELNPDTSFQTGDLTGQGAPTLPVSGNFKVWEVFGEAQIPIVQNSFIDELTLSVGYRKSWYTTQQRPQVRHGYVQAGAGVRSDPATSASVVRTTGRFALRTSRSCSHRSSSASTAANDPCAKVHHGNRLRLSRAGPGRRPVAVGEPGRPVQRPARRQPEPDAGKGHDADPRHRDPAALHPEAGADGRLVGHQAGERDPGLRRGRHPECLRCQLDGDLHVAGLRAHPARCGGLALADRRMASSSTRR